jgi:hypothetical protein
MAYTLKDDDDDSYRRHLFQIAAEPSTQNYIMQVSKASMVQWPIWW